MTDDRRSNVFHMSPVAAAPPGSQKAPSPNSLSQTKDSTSRRYERHSPSGSNSTQMHVKALDKEMEARRLQELGPETPLPEEFRPIPVPVASFPSLAETPKVAFSFPLADRYSESRSSMNLSTFEGNRDDIINKEKDIDAMCVNCQEYITLTEIDDHSYMCYQPSYQEVSPQEEVAIKIKKLHRGINKRMREASGDRLMILIRLREIAVEVTRNAEADLPKLELELEDLALTSVALNGGLCCSLMARRLASLLGEKELELKHDSGQEHFVTRYSKAFEQQRHQLLTWKGSPGQSPEKKGLGEVKSDIGSDNQSAASRCSAVVDCDIADLASAEEGLQHMSEVQLKKYFYSRCLKHKLLLPKTHPGQKVLVSGLYEEVNKRALPVSQWDQFIRESLAV